MFLMPSRYEPCGLNQMYSLRYGTVPIVRATGGLKDTVRDYDHDPVAGNGFVFPRYSVSSLLDALARALTVFKTSDRWAALQRRGMTADFSWERSARTYLKLYEAALGS